MPMYESMLVTSTTLDEEAASAVVARFTSLIEANGTLDAVEEWGKRRLAYPINKEEDGVYTLFHFTSDADFPKELERVYNITDGVLRSLIIAKSEEMEAARLAAAERAAASKAAAEKAAEARAAAEKAAAEAAPAPSAQPETAEPAAKAEEAPAEPKAEEAAAEPAAEEAKAEAAAEPAAEAEE